MYSMSAAHATSNGRTLALAYGNRSAVTLKLGRAEEAIRDIDRTLNLPADVCGETLRNKSTKRRIKAQEIMDDPQRVDPKDEMRVQITLSSHPPQKLYKSEHTFYPNCSSALEMRHDLIKGRCLYARQKLPAGALVPFVKIPILTPILRERAYASILHGKLASQLCSACCNALPLDWIACRRCVDPNIRFCNELCEGQAWTEFHKFECENDVHFHDSFMEDDVAIKLALVIRLMSRASVEELRMFDSSPDRQIMLGTKYGVDFASILSLTGEHDDRPLPLDIENYLARIRECGKWREIESDSTRRGELVERVYRTLLAKMGRNMHGILPLFMQDTSPQLERAWRETRDSQMASGLFCLQAIFNHSCLPNITSTHVGNTVEVRAMRDIQKGEELVQSYGPRYGEDIREVRMQSLRSQYKFECSCRACVEEKYAEEELRLLSYVCEKCAEPRVLDADTGLLCLNCCHRQKFSSATAMKVIDIVNDTLKSVGEERTPVTTLLKMLPSLNRYHSANHFSRVELLTKCAEIIINVQAHAAAAVDIYEDLLKHFERFFGIQSEQYEKILYETVIAYCHSERCNERMIDLCRLSMRLLVEQTGIVNARKWVAMRYGRFGRDYFDSLFRSFGLKYLTDT